MSTKFKCWSCSKGITFKSVSKNDGTCPKCNAEIEMDDLAMQLQKYNHDLIVALEKIVQGSYSDISGGFLTHDELSRAERALINAKPHI